VYKRRYKVVLKLQTLLLLLTKRQKELKDVSLISLFLLDVNGTALVKGFLNTQDFRDIAFFLFFRLQLLYIVFCSLMILLSYPSR